MDVPFQSCPNRNNFCYVCSLYTPKNYTNNITETVIQKYEAFYRICFTPNLWYTPEIICDYCYRSLLAHQKDKRHTMKYVRPTIWLSVIEHNRSCYFCSSMPSKHVGFRWETREQINYAHSSCVQPAKIRNEIFNAAPGEMPDDIDFDNEIGFPVSESLAITSEATSTEATTSEFVVPQPRSSVPKVPHLITQKDFYDVVRESKTSQRSALIWASRLQQWNLVAPGFKVTATLKRQHADEFDKCFSIHEETGIAYCNDVEALFGKLDHPHDPSEWRLFLDSSVSSFKGVLIRIGNKYPSMPVIYGTKDKTKEDYSTLKLVLHTLLKYNTYEWKICSDLKVVTMLTGLKGGYPHHQCFLCLWEGRKKELHYTEHVWEARESLEPGQYSVERQPLINDTSNIILPPLHIKLGLVRQFVRALDSKSMAFQTLKVIFPSLSAAKIENGCFNGPQIDKLFKSDAFLNLLKPIEKEAFKVIHDVIENFLGNRKSNEYEQIVKKMIEAFKQMKVAMSLKVLFLDAHLNFFPENCGDCSDEHGERFHQDVMEIEKRYKGKDIRKMLGEYCWSICRDTSPEEHKRKTNGPIFLKT